MKKLFFILSMLVSVGAFSQTTGFFRYDTVTFQKPGGNSEFNLLNSTRGVTSGVLTNMGNGRTAFVTPSVSGPSGANTWVQFNKNGVLGSSPKFVFDTITNKLSLPTGNLSVNGNSDFVAGKFLINNALGLGPTIEIPRGSGKLSFVLDSNEVATSNGNILFFQRGTAAKDYPILYFTTYDQNTLSSYSVVFSGFTYTSSNGTGKPLLITTQGFSTFTNAGNIILRPRTDQSGTFIGRKSGNANIDLDPLGQGVNILRNTIQMDVITVSGATTIDNTSHYWVFTGSSDVAWNAPTVSGNTGNVWTIKNRGTAIVTLTRQGSDQLYSTGTTTTYDINPGEDIDLKVDGTYVNIHN